MAPLSPRAVSSSSTQSAAVGPAGALRAEAEISADSAELITHEHFDENINIESIDEVPGGEASFWSCVLNQVCDTLSFSLL
jgi:hypothetical protein